MNVGFIGLGLMGSGVARNILEAGHDLVVWNRSPEKTAALAAAGAAVAPSIAAACAGREVVATMVANDEALLDVVGSDGGIRDALERGAIHLVMGTHGVDAVRRIAALHAEAGQVLVAAPVLGRPEVAAAGRLGIIAAGPPAAVARCAPLFDAAGRRTFDAGADPLAATVVKLANNFTLGCAIEAMAEAFALTRGYGLSPETLHEVLTDGLFAGSPAYAGYGRAMVEGRYEPPGMRAVLALKDVDLILTAAGGAGVPLPSAGVYRETLAAAVEEGDGDRDWAVVARTRAHAATNPPAAQHSVVTGVDFVSIPTRDFAAATEFYGTTLGLPCSSRYGRSPGAEFETGSLTLQVIESEAFGMEFRPINHPIALHVDDVEAARAELESRGVEFREDTLDSGVCHMAFFRDPDGNALMLHHRYAPRASDG
jgi:3-hydroxyisobutyrate dehydrogenase-like beta-hydroxyacid dehydrogenase/catechol 2,3-dioxygenase-like lactoylglutathione lyase family enzyme